MADRIRDYPHRLTILVRTTRKDNTFGEAVPKWSGAGSVYGRVEELSANQDRSDQQIESRAEVRIVLRGRVTISANDRLYWKGLDATYRLDGVHKSEVETICGGYRVTEKDE